MGRRKRKRIIEFKNGAKLSQMEEEWQPYPFIS
jgi:hypothetical protein